MENKNLENENIAMLENTTEDVVEEKDVAEETAPASEEAQSEDVAEAETAETVVEETAKGDKEEKKSKKEKKNDDAEKSAFEQQPKKKTFAFAGLLAIILICSILWVAYSGIFANKYAEIYNTSKMSALYIKDNSLKSHRSNGKIDVVTTSSNDEATSMYSTSAILSATSLRSPDGTALFFYENFDPEKYTGDLFVRYNNGKKIAIDTEVTTGLLVSANGKVLLYAKSSVADDGTASVAFYCYKKNGKPTLITENYSPAITPMLSYSAKYVAFAAPDAETGTTALYVTKLGLFGPKTTKVADNVVQLHSVNDSGYVYFNKTIKKQDETTGTALCYTAPNKKITVVAEDAVVREDCIGQLTNNFAFYLNLPENKAQFYASKTNKVPDLLFEETNFYLNPDVENKNYIFITVSEEDPSLLTIHRMNGKKLKTIAENVSLNGINNVLNSRDYNKITYMRNFNEETYSGEFFMSKTILGFTQEIKIADDVTLATTTPDMKYVAYFTNFDLNTGRATLNLYNGRKSTVVAENVPYYSVSFSGDNKTLFYLSDVSEDNKTGTLVMAKTKSPAKSTVVDTDISLINLYEFMYSARTNGSVYYLKNYDETIGLGDLYFAKKGKNPKLVEAGTSGLILE